MLVISIFSSSHNVFYSISNRNYHLCYIYFVVCKCFQFGQGQIFVIREWFKKMPFGKGLMPPLQREWLIQSFFPSLSFISDFFRSKLSSGTWVTTNWVFWLDDLVTALKADGWPDGILKPSEGLGPSEVVSETCGNFFCGIIGVWCTSCLRPTDPKDDSDETSASASIWHCSFLTLSMMYDLNLLRKSMGVEAVVGDDGPALELLEDGKLGPLAATDIITIKNNWAMLQRRGVTCVCIMHYISQIIRVKQDVFVKH